MTNNVLYFPYIDVPKSNFLTTSFLYWDKVYTVAPYGSDMVLDEQNENKALIDIGALEQVQPENYVEELPNFASGFVCLLDQLNVGLEYRNKGGWAALRNSNKKASKVHSAKLIDPLLTVELSRRGLIAPSSGFWLEMEPRTALYLMLYLSTYLSENETLDCRPTSDIIFNKDGTQKISVDDVTLPSDDPHHAILHNLFPTISQPLPAKKLAKIRNKYHDERVQFRKEVDGFVQNDLAGELDKIERSRRVQEFIARKKDQIADLKRQLEEYQPLGVASLGCATIGFASTAYSAANGLNGLNQVNIFDGAAVGAAIFYAAKSAVKEVREGRPDMKAPMVYAALLQHRK